nr:hypothetical protein CKG001_10040 [Bdellovibrio sp. CKG001]
MSILSKIVSFFSSKKSNGVESAPSGPFADTQNHGKVYFPAKGKFVQESHYATNQERFANGLFPGSPIEKIDQHLKASFEILKAYVPDAVFEKVYSDNYKRRWTPANDGAINEHGQAARGNLRPSLLEEIWQGNMFFKKLPPIGSKYLITAPNGRKCVIQMGYEIGPGGTKFLGGLTTEVHYYLGTNNESVLSIDVIDNEVPLGPYIEKEQPLPGEAPKSKGLDAVLRDELVGLVKQDLGQRETHGKNRSPLIDEINKSVKGAYLAAPYCISGLVSRGIMRLCRKHGFSMPLWMNTASTQEFYNNAPAHYRIPKGKVAGKGDIAIQQSYTSPGNGHAYMLTEDESAGIQKSIEYNTDGSGGRDGDGVYERVRTQSGDATKRYRGAVDVVAAILDYNNVPQAER